MTELDLPRHSDDLVAAAHRRDRARRLAVGVARRREPGLPFRFAASRMQQTCAVGSTHLLIGRLRALRDSIRRAALRAELSLTSQAVLSATDRLFDACRERGVVRIGTSDGARVMLRRRSADWRDSATTLVRSEAARDVQGMTLVLLPACPSRASHAPVPERDRGVHPSPRSPSGE
jgi:hypothetical protein